MVTARTPAVNISEFIVIVAAVVSEFIVRAIYDNCDLDHCDHNDLLAKHDSHAILHTCAW